jgi:RNA polymerase sigma factor (sigma-70 family)
MDEYQDLIFTLCYRMTSDYFESQDITQETFLAAFRNLDRVTDGNYKAWLCRIASNRCIDYLRLSGKIIKAAPEEMELPLGERQIESAEGAALERELAERLRTGCAKLRTPYNEVAALYFCEGMTAAEIAEARREKLKTVQTQIRRARLLLQKEFGDLKGGVHE